MPITLHPGTGRFVTALVLLALIGSLAGPLLPAPVLAAGPLYPDLRPAAPSSLYFDRTTVNGTSQYILRFSSTVWNAGEGRLELQGDPNPNGSNAVYQNIYDAVSGGSRVSQTRVTSDLLYHPSHYHYHFSDFASYRLLARDATGTYQSTTAEGTKTSFCILDYVRFNSNGPSAPRYTSCGGTIQGLSVGWSDTYVASLPEQWVTLGTAPLADGNYAVQTTVDPLNLLIEGGRDGNNTTATYFHVRNGVIILGTSTSEPPTGLVGRVVNTGGASLNCRATPNGTIIARIPSGATVQVTGAAQSGWLPVVCSGQAGWVSASYLQVTGGTAPTPSPTASATPNGTIGVVMNTGGTNLNCRATPNGTIIARLPAGSTVPVRGAVQNGWVPVTCGGQSGWVSAAYLRIDNGTTTEPPENQTATVINTGGAGVRCRTTAVSGAIITVLPEGTTVEVTGATQGGWVPVVCGDRSGWVSASYLRLNPRATPTLTPSPIATATATVTILPTEPTVSSTVPPPTIAPTQVPATSTSLPTIPPTPTESAEEVPTEAPTEQPATETPTEESAAPGDLIVTLLNDDGDPIGGACFELVDADGATTATSCDTPQQDESPNNGRTGFYGVPAGTYDLVQQEPVAPYEPASETEVIIQPNQQTDLRLTAQDGTTPTEVPTQEPTTETPTEVPPAVTEGPPT